MRSALAALALVALLPVPLHAAEWTRITVKDQHEHYYDRGKVTIDGESITYWRRVVFRPPQPTRNGAAGTAMYRERIDCDLHTHRTLGYLLYAPDGGVLENVYTPEAAPDPIIPETVGDRFEAAMCALVTRERSRNVGRRAPADQGKPEATPVPAAAPRAPADQAPSASPPADPAAADASMNQAQLLTEIARLEARLEQLRARVVEISAPTPVVREAPPLTLSDPLVVRDTPPAPVLPAGTPTP